MILTRCALQMRCADRICLLSFLPHQAPAKPHPVMKDLLKKGSILILLGTGGVGKTTVAAALGLAAAEASLDTALITVDPARRLREALGLSSLVEHQRGFRRMHCGLRASIRS